MGDSMSTIINATTTNGVVIQPDNSGSLVLQTNSGTTALTIDTSQRAAFVAGTAALPAITTTGDTDTGIWFPAANVVASSTSGTERMRIDSSGNVGIGTTSPGSFGALTVSAPSSSFKIVARNGQDGEWSEINCQAGATGQIQAQMFAQEAGASSYVKMGARSNHALFLTTNDTERMRITNGGEVYIAGSTDRGAFNLQCNGTGVWGAGAYTNGSDERIKENITPLDTGLDVVAKLNPVTYKYKEEWSRDQSIQTGFIAQDLLVALEGKNYVDGIVNQSSEYMSVAYQNIIPILTKAIQEQQTIINDLKARVETLEAK